MLSNTVCDVFELTPYDLAADFVARTCIVLADRGKVSVIDLSGEAMQKARDFLGLIESVLDGSLPEDASGNWAAYRTAVKALEDANPKIDGLAPDDEFRWYIGFLQPRTRIRTLPIEDTIMVRRMAEFFRAIHMQAHEQRILLASIAVQ